VASWLASRFKLGWGPAREQVRVARSLEGMPVTREALEAGDISFSGVKVLVATREVDPEAFARSEETLVGAARIHSVSDLGRVAAYWRQAVEHEHAAEGEEKRREQRRLHASVSLLGMVRVDGNLDPETGEACSPPWGRCWMPRLVPAAATLAPLRSAVPMPWGRSATSGWMALGVRPLPANGHT
jgi:Domain of unknown function (DUF222)